MTLFSCGNLIYDADYNVGDKGLAGGWVFYDKGHFSDGWRYLEAAPSDQSTSAQWSMILVLVPGVTSNAIGTGRSNTDAIYAQDTNPANAGGICLNYSGGGFKDWFLPSRDELKLMYVNLEPQGVGDFAWSYYWSSSEVTANSAWAQDFGNGDQGSYYKYSAMRVRAVRAF